MKDLAPNFVHQDLRLKEDGRELIYKGALGKRGNAQGDSGDLMVFLFDHALLMVKPKSKVEQYKVYRRVSRTFFGTDSASAQV